MADLSDKTKQKFWPTPEKFFEAVDDLRENLRDFDLSRGTIDSGPLGVPKNITSTNATVFKVHWNGQDWALRCFLRGALDLQQRYTRIKAFLQQHNSKYFCQFDYQAEGIRVYEVWYPIVKMDWVDGQTLDQYVRVATARGGLNDKIAETFKRMCAELEGLGIAHGDLQHGNIIVRDEQMYLVDYDGMYVPTLSGSRANEFGSRNYQHPKRTTSHFGPYLDNFSAWVIYTSLKALAHDPQLFHRLVAGEDALLFRQEDFANPLLSPAFAVLEHCDNPEIVTLTRFIRWQLDQPVEQIPPLSARPTAPADLPPLSPSAPTKRTAARSNTSSGNAAYANAVFAQRQQRTTSSLPTAPASPASQPAAALPLAESDVTMQFEKPDSALLAPPGIEPELLAAAPRKVISVQASLNPIVLVQTLKHKSIVQSGTATRGRVTEKLMPKRGLTGHKIRYRFEYQDGEEFKEIETTMDVNAQQFEQINFAEEITVVYMPGGNPSVIYKLSAYRAV